MAKNVQLINRFAAAVKRIVASMVDQNRVNHLRVPTLAQNRPEVNISTLSGVKRLSSGT